MADLRLTPGGLRLGPHRWPCTVGRGGLTRAKREGDGATPRGAHRIVGMFWRPDRLPRPAPWAEPIRPGDLWCDDPSHPLYNHLARAPMTASHERMRRADRLYDLVLVTDWNWPDAIPGAGSAIFLHRWRGPGRPTEGCIALRPDHLLDLARRIEPGTRLLVP